MGLKTTVYFSNVTNLSDARYAAGMMVDMIGFPIGNQENQVSEEDYKEIRGWIEGPKFVLETKEVDPIKLNEMAENLKFDYFHFKENNQTINFDQINKPCLVEFELNKETNFEEVSKKILSLNGKEEVSFFILNIAEASLVDSLELETLYSQVSVLLTGELSVEEFTTLPDTYPLEGINVKGGNEEKPGFRNFDEVADILEALDEY